MEKRMNMFDWYKKVVFQNYANFSGRARRSEYWYFTLCNFLIMLPLYLLMGGIVVALRNTESLAMMGSILSGGIITLYALAIFIPSLAVAIRRLHDVGRSGWNYLLILIPLVGPIIILVWMFTDSQPGPNKWGPNPKDVAPTTFDFDNKDLNFNQ